MRVIQWKGGKEKREWARTTLGLNGGWIFFAISLLSVRVEERQVRNSIRKHHEKGKKKRTFANRYASKRTDAA